MDYGREARVGEGLSTWCDLFYFIADRSAEGCELGTPLIFMRRKADVMFLFDFCLKLEVLQKSEEHIQNMKPLPGVRVDMEEIWLTPESARSPLNRWGDRELQ